MFERLTDTLLHGEGVMTGSVLLCIGLVGIAVLRVLLAPGHRSRLRLPAVMVVSGAVTMMALGALSLRDVFTPRMQLWFSVLPVALLLFGYGRLLSVAFFDWLLTRSLQTDAPRIVRDIVDGLFSAFALLITLGALGVEPGSLLTTSAVLTAVLGLSLQDTLGNLFAGLALQVERPFTVGDWIQLDRDGAQLGRVTEINWRATRLVTFEAQELTVPNSMLARNIILNHSRSNGIARVVQVVLPFELPTQHVHELLLRATEGVEGIRTDPPPRVLTQAFTELGVRYDIRYHIDLFTQRGAIDSNVRDRMWYLLQRGQMSFATGMRGASMPLPEAFRPDQAARARAIRKIDFLQGLPESAIETLAAGSRTELYAPGELVVRQGELGDELYLCLRGELKVMHQGESGDEREVSRVHPGGFFGEFAQLTGQARVASVRTVSACELVVVRKQAFAQVLTENPALAESISERLAARRAELQALERAPADVKRAELARHKGQLLQRIREFFLDS